MALRSATGALVSALLESQRLGERRAARGAPGGRVALTPGHVVLEGADAALTLELYETLGRERAAGELTLVGAEEDDARRLDGAAEHAALERQARRAGAWFSRAGNGPAHQVYAARFGAPGRLVLGIDPRIGRAGALGALALATHPVEAAAVMGGAPLERAWPETLVVRLQGRPPAWLSGDDIALELHRRLPNGAAHERVIEFRLFEPQNLAFSARESIAARAPDLGVAAAVFPSDEVTRRFLKAQGREADWKPLAFDPLEVEGPCLDLDFSDFEPLVARPGEIVRLKERIDAPVTTVWVGPEASLSDLARLARVFADQPLAKDVACVVTPGNRQLRESAAQAGWLDAIARAGARVRVPHEAPIPRRDRGLALACGVPLAAGERGWLVAGIEACAAAAIAGALRDPRGEAGSEMPAERDAYVVDDRLLARPPAEAEAAETGNALPALAPAITGPLRGVVLLALGDFIGVDRILPWGARVRPLARAIDRLAAFAFAAVDGTFVERARAHGGGVIVAGRGLGAGPRREQTALVLVALGVRMIAARSFDPEFRRQLRQHGILALRLASDADADGLRVGDEIEIPDLPEGLEAGKPLVVRNLTRGAPFALHHDLDPAGIEEVRAGGLLAWLRARKGPAARWNA